MMDIPALLAQLSAEDYCYLTTTGRVSGRPHEIEIWFGVHGGALYLLSGSETSDWLKNLRKNPAVTVRVGSHTFHGSARLVSDADEDARARTLLADKYHQWGRGKTLSRWARTALPIAIDISALTDA